MSTRIATVLAAAIMWLGLSQPVSADGFYDPRISLRDLNLGVRLQDNAVDGCWTNLAEVRSYTTEKLIMRGVRRINQPSQVYTVGIESYEMVIAVIAARTGSGDCSGTVLIEIGGYAVSDQMYGVHKLAGTAYSFWGYADINRYVIEKVQKFINSLN